MDLPRAHQPNKSSGLSGELYAGPLKARLLPVRSFSCKALCFERLGSHVAGVASTGI